MNYASVNKTVLIPLLQELIQNKCVNDGTKDSGNETKNALSLKRFFESYGLEPELLHLREGRDNIIVRIEGKDPTAPSLMYMSHLDVVPANESEWTYPPFGAEIHDELLYGRGAVDMLNMTAAMAVAFAELYKNGQQPEGDLIFCAVADEEAGGKYGAAWLTDTHWEKVKCDYLVGELGGFFLETQKGPGITYTVGEKGVMWTKLKLNGTAAHGSMPFHSNNASIKAAEAVRRIQEYNPDIAIMPVFEEMADALSQNPKEAAKLKHPRKLDKALESFYQRDPGTAKFLHATSRMTISPNVINSGSKVNIISDQAEIHLDIRCMPEQSPEYVQQELQKALGDLAEETAIEFTNYFPANISSMDSPLVQATKAISKEEYPDHQAVPFYIGAVTDCRFWRARGTEALGFCLFDPELTNTEYTNRIHCKDERIKTGSLEKSLKYFYQLPIKLSEL